MPAASPLGVVVVSVLDVDDDKCSVFLVNCGRAKKASAPERMAMAIIAVLLKVLIILVTVCCISFSLYPDDCS